jgi:hypothetical protein
VIDHDLTLQMARVVGSSMSRVANAVVDAVDPGDDLRDGHVEEPETSAGDGLDIETTGGDDRGDGETEPVAESQPVAAPRGEAFAAVAPVLVPNLIEIMGLVWRRHLQDAARARMAREQAATDPSHMVVGFADLVGFTALSQQLGPHELAEVVERFGVRLSDELKHRTGRGFGGRALCGGAPDLRRSALPVVAAKTSAVRPATELRRKALPSGGMFRPRSGLGFRWVRARPGGLWRRWSYGHNRC